MMTVFPNPKAQMINSVTLTDTELRYVMRNASAEADRIIRAIGDNGSVGARMRAMQTELAKVNAQMWTNVKDATTVGIGDAFDASAEWQAAYDAHFMRSVGASQPYWRNSMLASSRTGISSYISRKQNGITLSDKVYRNQALSKGYVDRTINNGLILNKTSAEIAADVKKYIDPRTPGGASYAAMRLGRTEVANAYHRSALNRYADTPWIETVKWFLSDSHGRADECNDYAESSHFPGGAAGEFLVMDVPGLPHPQCLCYVAPVPMDLDKFAKNFQSGRYDNYIDEQMGCTRVA